MGIKDKCDYAGFRNAGLLWWVNMILHTFGWVIKVKIEGDGSVSDMWPERTKWRGFSMKDNQEGYIKVSHYLKENVDELLKESKE
jgi:hypothetical protein